MAPDAIELGVQLFGMHVLVTIATHLTSIGGPCSCYEQLEAF